MDLRAFVARAAALLGVLALLAAGLSGVGAGAATAASAASAPGADGATDTAGAATPAGTGDGGEVELVLFWGDGCPHCEAERQWLAEIEDDYPNLTITEYEVWYDEENQQRFADAGEEYGFEPSGVPTTIVAGQVWVGFSEATQRGIEQGLLANGAAAEPSASGEASGLTPIDREATAGAVVDVPLLGEVSLGNRSLVVSTLAIGFVDGINPCSLWVISVLLAIVVRTGSRGRVLAIGSTFLLITAGMYALFMVGIYSALSVIGYLGAVQVVVALVAGVLGAVSVKDYFAFKKGLSFTIRDSSKPGIYRRMREASGARSLPAALAATAVLAVGVSLLETPCTAGFPVLWTGMLAANDVAVVEAVALFVLYMVPFLVDEFVVFGVAVWTMRAARLQERHGQLLKLVAGTTMLALAGTILVRPETMQEPLGALVVFVVALTVAGLTHWVTRQVRGPAGTEARPLVGADRRDR